MNQDGLLAGEVQLWIRWAWLVFDGWAVFWRVVVGCRLGVLVLCVYLLYWGQLVLLCRLGCLTRDLVGVVIQVRLECISPLEWCLFTEGRQRIRGLFRYFSAEVDDPFAGIQIELVLWYSILEGDLLPKEILELEGLANCTDHGLSDLVPLLTVGGEVLELAHSVVVCYIQ